MDETVDRSIANRDPKANRDIVVIGASAGGIEALKLLMGDLPADLPAAVFVVVHMGSTSPGVLPDILARAGPLAARTVEDGEPIERGRVYVAPPDRHMLIEDGRILLRRGPRENRSRPAIDPLFRTAAVSRGARVVGVVLTGFLNDGTAGLRAIKRCGGVAVVQDPADAVAPQMPQSALRHVEIDHCLPLAGMGRLLARLAAEPAGETPEIPIDIQREAAIAAQEHSTMDKQNRLGKPSLFSCPDCHGSLWEIRDGDLVRYRCHLGHAFTGSSLIEAQSDDMEQALSSALRSHEERAELLRRMARQAEERQRAGLAADLTQRAREFERDAVLIRRILVNAGDRCAADSEIEAAS